MITNRQKLLWANRIVSRCLRACGDDTDAGLQAADYILSTQPFPDEVEIEQDAEDENGDPPIPVDNEQPLSAFFAYDIFNRQAQGILNRSLQAARGLSASARKDLAAALKRGPRDSGEAILAFIEKYRLQLARLLSATQFAAVLEGAREVAAKVPPLGTVPVEGLPVAEQERIVAAQAPPTPPFAPPVPPAGAPESIHFPIIDEAVKQLSEKRVMTRQQFDALDAAAKAKAFAVAGVDAQDTLTKIRDALAENVREGADYATFKQAVMGAVDEGTFLSDAHREVVFRTNVQGALSDGQFMVVNHPLVRSGFPYVARDAIHDDRARHNHLALEKLGIQGTNVYRIDDPVWQTFRVPWDYNDRCADTFMTVRQAAERGITEAREWLDTGVEPSPPAFVSMPPFEPPPGFQRAVASAPLSVRLSMQSLASFAVEGEKPEEETDSSLLYGAAEAGVGATGMLDTATEGKSSRAGARVPKPKVGKGKRGGQRQRRRSLFRRLRVRKNWRPSVSLSTDATGHQHKGKGQDGGQFTAGGGSGASGSGTGAPVQHQPKSKQSWTSPIRVARAKFDRWKGSVQARATALIDRIPGGKAVRTRAALLKDKLEKRYGTKAMKAIVASGYAISWGAFSAGAAVGAPIVIPSAVAMLPALAIAELHHQFRRGDGGVASSISDEYEYVDMSDDLDGATN